MNTINKHNNTLMQEIKARKEIIGANLEHAKAEVLQAITSPCGESVNAARAFEIARMTARAFHNMIQATESACMKSEVEGLKVLEESLRGFIRDAALTVPETCCGGVETAEIDAVTRHAQIKVIRAAERIIESFEG
jgi:predicted helicase